MCREKGITPYEMENALAFGRLGKRMMRWESDWPPSSGLRELWHFFIMVFRSNARSEGWLSFLSG